MYIASDQSRHWSATWDSRLEPALAGITQCTKLPKALKEFKGEDDCDERQLEKDGREVRRMKFKSMAAPPRIIDTQSTDVIGPVAFALDVLPVTLGSQCK